MATTGDAFATYCVELLSALGSARARRMFGGHGLYIDDLFVGIVADEELFLKVDAQTREHFEAAGCRPFVYGKAEQTVAMSFWSAPEAATESPGQMLPWARLAQAAALRSRAGKPLRQARTTRPSRGAANRRRPAGA